ncbi:recombinase family protein [Actinospica durhamensis]|uniref:Recombinase family protein n=1 Tax=Actinospica durhamensis TaxID=1508375 RepID=A0A941EVH0_9ACTN|nr:recombinase family protein [Actinospica durhamensis]MBR7837183.1 recombinase family protein [Actinospica durhamensis]
MRKMVAMGESADWPVHEYDGCGRDIVGGIRLSRKTDRSSSPEKQRDQILSVAQDNHAHIIGWAKDLEVSGATDPHTRPELGPWLMGKMGPYDGMASAAVDRVGRDVYEGLNLGREMQRDRRLLFTYGHDGPWNLADPNDENQFLFQLFGAQMELRAIQRRNRESTEKARNDGRVKHKNSYGYRYERTQHNGRVEAVVLDEEAAAIIREVANRILNDDTGTITVYTEAVRLTRAQVPSPSDRRAILYGREPKGTPWTALGIKGILMSPAALGHLVHKGQSVLGPDGEPRQISDEALWDFETHTALKERLAPRKASTRAPHSDRLMSGRGTCGGCRAPLYVTGRPGWYEFRCTARVRGIPGSENCTPAPGMLIHKLDKAVNDYFTGEFGRTPLTERRFVPGTAHAARITEIEARRKRLRQDRDGGLYNSPDDEDWYRTVYGKLGQELEELKALPQREGRMEWVLTGRTIADDWQVADTIGKREILANYDVRVVMYPHGHTPRLWIHHLTPTVEADALNEQADAEDYEREANDQAQEAQEARTAWLHAVFPGRDEAEMFHPCSIEDLRSLGIDPASEHELTRV